MPNMDNARPTLLGNYVTLTVSDTGVGMTSEEMEKIAIAIRTELDK